MNVTCSECGGTLYEVKFRPQILGTFDGSTQTGTTSAATIESDVTGELSDKQTNQPIKIKVFKCQFCGKEEQKLPSYF